VVNCLKQRALAYGPADATASRSTYFIKIWYGSTFLVPAYPACPLKRLAIKQGICLNSTNFTDDRDKVNPNICYESNWHQPENASIKQLLKTAGTLLTENFAISHI